MNERAKRVPSIEAFGEELLRTEDLDPLYSALVGANLERNQLRRFLFAYWCCYSAGAAAWLSECIDPLEYWSAMRHMAENTPFSCPLNEGHSRWPRGHERRHFRGPKAVEAVDTYTRLFPVPENVCVWFEDESLSGRSFAALRRKVLTLPQFGPWIAFKVGDMLERVLNRPVDFTDADVLMFEQPYSSALEVWKSDNGDLGVSDKRAVSLVAARLIMHFRRFDAPPQRDRPVGIQEVETILCKWKSHNNGSYPVGNDTRELRHGLKAWGAVSEAARQLILSAPEEVNDAA